MTASSKPHKLYNLILPISLARGQVLLGFKKRGFGIGKYNGFGGKVEPGETLVASAARELQEESGIVCSEQQLQHHAVLLLESVAVGAEKELVLEIHVYMCTEWEGEIVESEEMRPQWFLPAELPVADMWEETRVWMKAALELYLPAVAAPLAVEEPPTETRGEGRGERRRFIHYVDYTGALNPQTGKWDPWHGMGRSVWEWFDGPVEDWSGGKIEEWAEEVRRGVGFDINAL